MADSRLVKTKFWTDTYIQTLSMYEKLLYLYLITNKHTCICGVYEISFSTICFETGLVSKKIIKCLERFEQDNKIYYIDGWIMIHNFIKNQNPNDSIVEGMIKAIYRLPKKIKERINIDFNGFIISEELIMLFNKLPDKIKKRINKNCPGFPMSKIDRLSPGGGETVPRGGGDCHNIIQYNRIEFNKIKSNLNRQDLLPFFNLIFNTECSRRIFDGIIKDYETSRITDVISAMIDFRENGKIIENPEGMLRAELTGTIKHTIMR
ncbi:MAG: hypothetical protein ACFFG0_03695 [Candidatus Thorarchaeota archaeon]